MIRFTVYGLSQPAGSKQAFVPLDKNKNPYRDKNGRIIVNIVDDNPKSKGWKKQVAVAAKRLYTGALLRGPVKVRFIFYRPRIQGHFRTGKFANELRADAPRYPIVRPDALKLARATEDALTGVIWADDSQIVTENIYKRFGDPRVEIEIEEVL